MVCWAYKEIESRMSVSLLSRRLRSLRSFGPPNFSVGPAFVGIGARIGESNLLKVSNFLSIRFIVPKTGLSVTGSLSIYFLINF